MSSLFSHSVQSTSVQLSPGKKEAGPESGGGAGMVHTVRMSAAQA